MAHGARDLRQKARKALRFELQLGATLPPIEGSVPRTTSPEAR